MKVLVFTSLYPNNIWPHHGVFVKERMTQFAKIEGCQVKVVAPVPYCPSIKINYRWLFSQVLRQEKIEGIDVYHPRYFMIPKVGMALQGFLMFLSVLPVIRKLQRDFSFDLIDAHYVYPDGFAAVLLGRLLGKPVTVSARGSDINLFQEFFLIRRLLRYTLSQADGVIAVCQALKESIVDLQIPAEKVTVVPNGVDPKKFYPIPKKEARQQLDLPNRKIILSVGSLIPRKGFDLLIRALRILVTELKGQDLYLVIVGEGPAQRELERLITLYNLDSYVYLAGDVPHHDLYRWYSAADLFCLASSREGWPNVVLESLACGTPVVATAVWGTPEIIRSDEIGLLTERSEQALAAKISRALNKPWQPDVIVRYTREQTWDKVADMVLQVFTAVLNQPLAARKVHA